MKIKNIINLIKTSVKYKIITGTIVVAVVGGAVTGIIIYNTNNNTKQVVATSTGNTTSNNSSEKTPATASATKDGDKKTTEVKSDGTTVTTEVKSDGTKVVKTTDKNGKVTEVVKDKDGKVVSKSDSDSKQTPSSTPDPTPQPAPAPAPQPSPTPTPTPAPAPQPKPQPKPAPSGPQADTITLSMDGSDTYFENTPITDLLDSYTRTNYSGPNLTNMRKTNVWLGDGSMSESAAKNSWLGKCIDGKYRVTEVRVIYDKLPLTDDRDSVAKEKASNMSKSSSSIRWEKIMAFNEDGNKNINTRLIKLIIGMEPI